MKLSLFIYSILICALGGSFLGCRPSDSSEAANNNRAETAADNRQTREENNRAIENTAATAGNKPEKSYSAAPPMPTAKTGQTKTPEMSGAMITKFDNLKKGMSYTEVIQILGSAGEKAGEFKVEGGIMTAHKWKGTGLNGDWEIAAEFSDGKLLNKTQFGLK